MEDSLERPSGEQSAENSASMKNPPNQISLQEKPVSVNDEKRVSSSPSRLRGLDMTDEENVYPDISMFPDSIFKVTLSHHLKLKCEDKSIW